MPRLTCIVPGCCRTRGQRKGEPPIHEGEEWICGDHWREIPAHIRRRRTKLARRYRRQFGDTLFWKFPAGSANRIDTLQMDQMLRKAWSICRRAAFERAIWLR